MSTRAIVRAALLSVVVLNAWAGGGGAPQRANADTAEKYDATGTWTATIETGRGPAQTLVFVLKQDGDKVTGTVATDGATPVEISDGKAGREAVHFSVRATMPAMQMPNQPANPKAPPLTMVTNYTGKISGNDMELTRQMHMLGGTGGAMPMGGMGKHGGGGGMGGGMGGGGMGGGGMPMGGGMGGGAMPMGAGPGGMNAPITAHRQ